MFVILVNVIAFSPSLLNASTRTVPLPLTSLDLAHVLVSVTWLLMFMAQVTLVAAGRVTVHRRLGVLGVLLSAAFIVVTWLVLVEGARRGFDLSGDLVPRGTSINPRTFLAASESSIPFAAFVAAAVWYRRRPALHKRLMMLALLTSTGAPSRMWLVAGRHSRPSHWPVARSCSCGSIASIMSRYGVQSSPYCGRRVSRSLSADGRVAQFRCMGRSIGWGRIRTPQPRRLPRSASCQPPLRRRSVQGRSGVGLFSSLDCPTRC